MPKDNGHWIEDAHMKKNKLRNKLDAKPGKKIPEKKLDKAAKSTNPKLKKEAVMAKTLRGLRK
jgi:hypothetical protein